MSTDSCNKDDVEEVALEDVEEVTLDGVEEVALDEVEEARAGGVVLHLAGVERSLPKLSLEFLPPSDVATF